MLLLMSVASLPFLGSHRFTAHMELLMQTGLNKLSIRFRKVVFNALSITDFEKSSACLKQQPYGFQYRRAGQAINGYDTFLFVPNSLPCLPLFFEVFSATVDISMI